MLTEVRDYSFTYMACQKQQGIELRQNKKANVVLMF